MSDQRFVLDSFHEIDHTKLPRSAVAPLKEILRVKVTGKTDYVVISYPSIKELRKCHLKMEAPAMDCELSLSLSSAERVLYKKTSPIELSRYKTFYAFWSINPFPMEGKDFSCLVAVKPDKGMLQWGSQAPRASRLLLKPAPEEEREKSAPEEEREKSAPEEEREKSDNDSSLEVKLLKEEVLQMKRGMLSYKTDTDTAVQLLKDDVFVMKREMRFSNGRFQETLEQFQQQLEETKKQLTQTKIQLEELQQKPLDVTDTIPLPPLDHYSNFDPYEDTWFDVGVVAARREEGDEGDGAVAARREEGDGGDEAG